MKSMSTEELLIADRAKKYKGAALTNLHQYINAGMLAKSYQALNKNSSPGVDGKYWYNYSLEGQLGFPELEQAFKSGKYRAPNVHRVYIPKGKTGKRPLGIPAIKDKVLQESVRRVLTPIYEEDFKDFSYGYRHGKSAHQAITKTHHWIKLNRHRKIKEIIFDLNLKLRGYYNYYGATFNIRRLNAYYHQVKSSLHKWLNRRGGKSVWTWAQFIRLVTEWHPLLKPRIYHSSLSAKPI